jgi:hypothetical protein
MAEQRPSAAAALYPHLRRDDPPQPPRAQRLATLFPRPQTKPPSNPGRESLLRHLRELNRRIDERLARERRR